MVKRLTHIGADGRAQMVDVSSKPPSIRTAVAIGKIQLRGETLDLISKDQIAKGNVFATARIAGIQAAKQTAQLIPLCHTLPLGEIKIDISRRDSSTEVAVTDNGAGIAPEHLPRVFDRFYRADSSRSSDGTGLGLALVKSIVDLHGGLARIESKVDRGTTVVLSFPRKVGLESMI